MKQLTETEANELLTQLIKSRKKHKKLKTKESLAEYNRLESLCAHKFDYLVDLSTRRYKMFSNYNDLQQEGRIALLAALRNFDIKKGSFFWWANRYIKTKISREANCHSTIKIPLKKAHDMQPHKLSYIPQLIELGFSPLETLEQNELIKKINNAINKLPDDQKQIIVLNGIKSYPISKISQDLKLTRITCVKLLNAAKENLKHNLESI